MDHTLDYSQTTLNKVAAAHMAIGMSLDALRSGKPFPVSTLLATRQLVADAYTALGRKTDSMDQALARFDEIIEMGRGNAALGIEVDRKPHQRALPAPDVGPMTAFNRNVN